MTNIGAVVLGVIDIAIVVAVLILVGLIIVWFANMLKFPIPWDIQRVYLAIVALIALYMLVALLFGLPRLRFMSSASDVTPGGYVPAPQTQVIR